MPALILEGVVPAEALRLNQRPPVTVEAEAVHLSGATQLWLVPTLIVMTAAITL